MDKPTTYWVIIHPNNGPDWTSVADTRTETIEAFAAEHGFWVGRELDWPEFRRMGYRCARVTVAHQTRILMKRASPTKKTGGTDG